MSDQDQEEDGIAFTFTMNVETTHNIPPELQDKLEIEDDEDGQQGSYLF